MIRKLSQRRERQKRNFMATLLLSQGVPMILGGDEISRTQNGNNNAYCQDNETTWVDWNLDDRKIALLEFTQKLIQIRRDHPNLHRRKFYQGPRHSRHRRERHRVAAARWPGDVGRGMGTRLGAVPGPDAQRRDLGDVDDAGEPVKDDTFLIMLNCHHEPIQFYMPKPP